MYKEALKLIKEAEDFSNDPWVSRRPIKNRHNYLFDFNKYGHGITDSYWFPSGKAGEWENFQKSLKAQDLKYNYKLSDKQNLANYQRSAKLHDINLKRRYQNK